jgi:hypothetical protein
MKLFFICIYLLVLLMPAAENIPQAEISNGLVKAKLYLPDSQSGFYRSTRFDWSGLICGLEYQGHSYFGQWFKAHDPVVRDIEYRAELNGFAVGTPSASMGPIEEFSSPIGYAEAAAGGTFIKVGVGILRKPDMANYSWSTKYQIVDPGKWTVHPRPDEVEFVHEVSGPAGYAYQYSKTVRLSKGKPELVLEHSLKNTGKQRIESPVYAHNFLVMDDQPSGPDFLIKVPFDIQNAADRLGVLKISGNEISYARELEKDERASVQVAGFHDDPKDYDIRVENRKTGAGVRITGNRPLARLAFWSIRPTRCPEPFINVRVEPGSEFAWRISYEFYTLPKQ